MKETCVMINVRDRPTELSMLLESLYFQTYKNFDIIILDDCSGTPLTNYHFFNCIVTRLILSGHKVRTEKTDYPHGVSKARQAIVDLVKNDYKYLARVDDDVILERDFLERLVKVIESGYDLASGVTPPIQQPVFKREPNNISKRIGNRVVLDKEGNYILNNDDFGILYTESKIVPAHHFRSSALYKSEIHKKVNYLPTKLTKHGFREEQIFSYKLLMEGYKIGIDTGAIAWHQMTPSGGERFQESNQLVQFNENILKEFTKENKEKLLEIFKDTEIDTQELNKEINLANRI